MEVLLLNIKNFPPLTIDIYELCCELITMLDTKTVRASKANKAWATPKTLTGEKLLQ